jgi:hypothetical protein
MKRETAPTRTGSNLIFLTKFPLGLLTTRPSPLRAITFAAKGQALTIRAAEGLGLPGGSSPRCRGPRAHQGGQSAQRIV